MRLRARYEPGSTRLFVLTVSFECSGWKNFVQGLLSEEDLQNKRKEFEASLEGKTQTEKGYLKMRYEKELTKPWPLYLLFAKVGISTQTLFAIKNEYGISLSTIDKLCTFFKCQPCDIMEFVKFEE